MRGGKQKKPIIAEIDSLNVNNADNTHDRQ